MTIIYKHNWYLWFGWQSCQMTSLAQPIVLIGPTIWKSGISGSADITPRPAILPHDRIQVELHGALEDDRVKPLEYKCLV